MQTKAELGKKGEAIAAKYYLQKGYHLFGHNLSCRFGELDVVVYDDSTVVVVEVKTRRHIGQILPREYVDYKKQKKIIAATKYFMSSFPQDGRNIRFDVVEILNEDEKHFRIHCIENAFVV